MYLNLNSETKWFVHFSSNLVGVAKKLQNIWKWIVFLVSFYLYQVRIINWLLICFFATEHNPYFSCKYDLSSHKATTRKQQERLDYTNAIKANVNQLVMCKVSTWYQFQMTRYNLVREFFCNELVKSFCNKFQLLQLWKWCNYAYILPV